MLSAEHTRSVYSNLVGVAVGSADMILLEKLEGGYTANLPADVVTLAPYQHAEFVKLSQQDGITETHLRAAGILRNATDVDLGALGTALQRSSGKGRAA